MMFAVLVGVTVRVTMSGEQRQQTLSDITGPDSDTTQMCRLKRLGEVEGKVDRYQQVEGERKEAEPRGPYPSSPRPQSHPVTPAQGALIWRRP